MKRALLIILLSLNFVGLSAQVEIATKANALYLCAGIMNPAAEFAISPKSTIQTEVIYSPWKSINNHHFYFGALMTEYRWHLKEHFKGVYFGINASMYAFNISKPYFSHGKIKINDGYAKGTGGMLGLCVGYEKIFAERWIVDAYFGWSKMWSFYNGYHSDGEIEMFPAGHENDYPHDPWNGSEEWYPNKIGVSLGYIFNKKI